MQINYSPKFTVQNMFKWLKNNLVAKFVTSTIVSTARLLEATFLEVGKDGWSTGNVTEAMIQEHFKQNRK